EQLILRGAVAVRVRGLRAGDRERSIRAGEDGAGAPKERTPIDRDAGAQAPPRSATSVGEKVSPELVAALREPPARPGRELLRLLRADGAFTPAMLLLGLALAACGGVAEAVLFRSLFEVGGYLGLAHQRFAAFFALIALLVALLVLDVQTLKSVLDLGRRLEARFRVAFLS